MNKNKLKFEKITVSETGHRSYFQVITSYHDHQDKCGYDIVNVFYTQRVQICASCRKKPCQHVNAVRDYTQTGHQQPSNPPLDSNQWQRWVFSREKMDQLYLPENPPKGYHIEQITSPHSRSMIFSIMADNDEKIVTINQNIKTGGGEKRMNGMIDKNNRIIIIADDQITSLKPASTKRRKKKRKKKQNEPQKLRKCKNCKATNANYKLYICKGCHKTRYCSTKCQKAHWKIKHSKKCINK